MDREGGVISLSDFSLPSSLLPLPPSAISTEEHIHLSLATGKDKVTFVNPLPVPKSQKHLESYLADCYDAIAVFLCIHIVLRFRNIAAKRDVPALDRSLSSCS